MLIVGVRKRASMIASRKFALALSVAGVACVAGAGPCKAQSTAVIDGDTIEYRGVVVHLWGIDAPEKGQACADGWPAGRAAIDHLTDLMHGRTVSCTLKSTADSPRVSAVCTAGGQDLSAAMASAGMAWALTSETREYTVQETNAMAGVWGVHGHPCVKAWEWRARQLKQSP